VAYLAVDAEDRSGHEVGSASPDICQAGEIPVLLDVLEGCAVGRQCRVDTLFVPSLPMPKSKDFVAIERERAIAWKWKFHQGLQ